MKINIWNDLFCPTIEIIVGAVLISGYFLLVEFLADFFASLVKGG
jgi:hypothetical protein|nr:MAG TPA: hypothetical protein [Caudoviricetes sp.]